MIDKKDKKIIKLLQSDSRISLTSLANELKITRNAVKYRIDKLESEGYIKKYTTIINPSKFGKKVTVIFNFNIPLNEINKCIKALEKYDSITNIYFTTGNYSIYAIGIFKNNEELNKFLINTLSKMPIQEYIVTPVLDKHKENFFELK